jgi:hypothetical protein
MFESKRNGSPPAAPAVTLGAARERLIANGYTPVSALDPHERVVAQHGPHVASEHPPAVLCCALVLRPIPDHTLATRVRALLEKRGLLLGPVRLGSDGVEMRPVRFSSLWPLSALGGSVYLNNEGMVPLDAQWPQSDLLTVPYAKLPEIAADGAQALVQEIDMLPHKIAEEQRPPPKPSRRAWLGAP